MATTDLFAFQNDFERKKEEAVNKTIIYLVEFTWTRRKYLKTWMKIEWHEQINLLKWWRKVAHTILKL